MQFTAADFNDPVQVTNYGSSLDYLANREQAWFADRQILRHVSWKH